MPSFSNPKGLKFIISLGSTVFQTDAGPSNKNQIIITGLRAGVDIDKAAGMMNGTLKARIYGLGESQMHDITTLAMQAAKYSEMQWQPNTITVFAIDGDAETLVFAGNIYNAWADYQGMPDVFLNIEAQACLFNRLAMSEPKSYKAPVNVANIMATLAKEMGFVFENNGVDVTLGDVYFDGTAYAQAQKLAEAAGINLIIDDNVLAITPPNTARKTKDIPVISKESGLIGYPMPDAAGVHFQAMFIPQVRFMHQFKLVSDQIRASGVWTATAISYRLESEKPGGAWFMAVRGNFEGTPYVGK